MYDVVKKGSMWRSWSHEKYTTKRWMTRLCPYWGLNTSDVWKNVENIGRRMPIFIACDQITNVLVDTLKYADFLKKFNISTTTAIHFTTLSENVAT